MAGFLTATVTRYTAAVISLPTSGSGALNADIKPKMPIPASLSSDGTLGAGLRPQFGPSASLDGSGALVHTIKQIYAPAPALAGAGALSAIVRPTASRSAPLAGGGALSATVIIPGPLDFIDTFNRADNASPGSPWIAPGAPFGDFAISSNMLVSTDPTNDDFLYYGPLSKDGQKVTVTMGFNSAGSAFLFQVQLRTNDDKSGACGVGFGLASYDGVTMSTVLNMFDAASNAVGAGPSRTDLTFVAGDTFAIMSLGDDIVLLKNGASVLTDNDPTHAISTTLNAGERTVTLYASAVVAGVVKIDSIRIQEIDSMPTYASLGGTGTLSATVTAAPSFTPFTETNVVRTNQPTPAGCSGVWVTLIGKGGNGGPGTSSNSNRGGAGGGGSGGYIPRVFIPVASLGPTYTTALVPNSVFGSGPIGLGAYAGGNGVGTSGVGGGSGGAGGVASTVDFTAPTFNGKGGASGGGSGSNGGDGGDGASGVAGGGGGGGGNVGTNSGGEGGTASAPGGSGGHGGSGGNTASSGGNGGTYGAGGGGGGSRNATSGAGIGGTGGPALVKLEWV